MADCPLCLTGDGKGGLHHHRSGAVYSGVCRLCGDTVSGGGETATARYWGESGDSGYCRTKQHVQSIKDRDEENAFAKHLKIYHPDHQGDINAFKFELSGTFSQPLVRQITESVFIHNNSVDIQMNSKSEWLQPMEERVVITRELGELEEQGARGRGSRGRNRRGGT